MKFYIFGSCSGTEPMPGRKHTSFAIEINNDIYWFDAGEGCSYTAHNMGVDLLKVKNICISHPHMDHVGGLGNLLWNIRKLSNVKNTLPYAGDINIYMPNMDTWKGIIQILENTEGHFKCVYDHNPHLITESILFNDDNMKVTAIHNNHMPQNNGLWESFSFLIEAEEKIIIYSGDVKEFSDIKPLLKNGCDVLMCETGHHNPTVICDYANDENISNLYFIHHGRDILYDYDGCLKKAKEHFNNNVLFLNDGYFFEV